MRDQVPEGDGVAFVAGEDVVLGVDSVGGVLESALTSVQMQLLHVVRILVRVLPLVLAFEPGARARRDVLEEGFKVGRVEARSVGAIERGVVGDALERGAVVQEVREGVVVLGVDGVHEVGPPS